LVVPVESQHGGTATFIQSVPVKETTDGKTIWEGKVHIFALAGNKLARRAYAWSSPIEGSTKRRFFAVLHIPPIDSPANAVRAAIVAEHRAK
jgi:hypothetical protein